MNAHGRFRNTGRLNRGLAGPLSLAIVLMHAARQARAIREQRELDESAIERQVEFHPHVHGAAPILSDSLGCPRPRKPISSHNRMRTAELSRAPLCATRPAAVPSVSTWSNNSEYAGSYH